MSSGGRSIKRGFSVRNSSEEYYDLYCQPCDVEGRNVEAKSYCKDCQEYLCSKCSAHHKTFKLMRKHVLLDVLCMSTKPPMIEEETSCSDSYNERSGSERSGSANLTRSPTDTTDAKRVVTKRNVTVIKREVSNTIHQQPGAELCPTSKGVGHSSALGYKHMKDIQVDGLVTSSTLMSKTKLLIATHSKVAIVDTDSGKQEGELRLSGRPGQVTRINESEAAVSLPQFKKILILRTKPAITVSNEISMSGEIVGIAFSAERGAFWGAQLGRVVCIDATGTITETIETDKSGGKIFSDPGYITRSSGTSSMYVSDWVGHMGVGRLVKLGSNGKVLATYSGEKSCYLHQVAVGDRGTVFVAVGRGAGSGSGSGSGSVAKLTDNCDKMETLVPDLPVSGSLSYNKDTHELYVGTTKGVIKVYTVE